MRKGEIVTDKSNPKLQPAQTGSYDHLIADLVYETDPAVFGCLVKEDRDLFRRWITPLWLSNDCSYTHQFATVCLENENLLGFIQGFSGERYVSLEHQSGKRAASVFSQEQLAYLVKCSRHINYVVPYIPKSAYYVHLLAVRENFRGRKIGHLLLENAFQTAADSGFKSVHLDVYEGNPALGFYERMGMEKRLETRLPAFQRIWKIPAHFRMVRDL